MADSANLAHLWVGLLTDVAEHLDPGEPYCAVRSIQGSGYKVGSGIAVIGRAPNGWAFYFTKEECDDRDKREALADRIVNVNVCREDKKIRGSAECGPMHWITHPYTYHGVPTSNDKIGGFWREVAKVIQYLEKPNSKDEWAETIAWTNLYPVSHACGNPNARLERAQRTGSAKLLLSVLQAWKPRAALFITEINRKERFSDIRDLEWSEPFHEALGLTRIGHRKQGPVVATGKMPSQDTCAFFIVRPDARQGVHYEHFAKLVADAVTEGCGSGRF